MATIDRRTFLLSSAAAVGTRLRRRSANDRIQIGVIGTGNRGRDHVNLFTKDPGSRVVAICDPDLRQTDRALGAFDAAGVARPRTYQDLRRLLEDGEVSPPDSSDAISTCPRAPCQAERPPPVFHQKHRRRPL